MFEARLFVGILATRDLTTAFKRAHLSLTLKWWLQSQLALHLSGAQAQQQYALRSLRAAGMPLMG